MNNFDELKENIGTLTILYIEDDDDLRNSVGELLLNFTDNLILAKNGKEGLKQYDLCRPDLIITDIQMPVMDGIEMIRQIRDSDHDFPIIVTTAYNDQDLLVQLIESGIEHYVQKPIDYDIFLGKLLNIGKMIKTEHELEEKNLVIMNQTRAHAMDEILKQIAHHWRQPLNTLALTIQDIEFAREANELDEGYLSRFSQKSMHIIKQMSSTINTFYKFSEQPEEVESFGLKEAVDECYTLLVPTDEHPTILFSNDIPPELSATNFRSAFQRCVLSILSNALEAINETERSGNILVTGAIEKNTIRLLFEDNGGGLHDVPVERIFEPYFTTKGPASGKGLGLYITKMIIQRQLDGNIFAANTDTGLKCTVTLPLSIP